jgi:predicted TIM-barrel fold metal-dependent hydrolase
MRGIDSHQHFWRFDAPLYPWIDAESALASDYLPPSSKPDMDRAGITACIAVQARQDEAETDWLIDLASEFSWIIGVIGWVDLAGPRLEQRLDRWSGGRLIGLRHLLQDEADDRFMLRRSFTSGVKIAIQRGLAYDILVKSAGLRHVPPFLDAVGQGALVLDHGGKPDIAACEWTDWATQIRGIADYPYVSCKLSGLVTQAAGHWVPDDFTRYLDHLFECFGPDRLIFGSDWPVCLLAADYLRVTEIISTYVKQQCPECENAIFGGTAKRVYRLDNLI